MSSAHTAALIDSVHAITPDIIALRKYLHQHPELSWQETATTEYIAAFLEQGGYRTFVRPLDTGGWVDLVFREGAPFIMLRADIDALPIQDEKTVPHRSTVDGVSHACAHDAHTATVAGAAIALQRGLSNLPYNLRFVFQPAEEPIESGASRMIEHGVLEGVAYALGMHMEPRLPLGSIGITPGWVNMQSTRLLIELKGPGGHSARPADTVDLLWLASRIIQDGYGIIYRRINHLDSTSVLTFTEIHAGQGYNVIPGTLNMTATLRQSDPQKRDRGIALLQQYLQHLETETGCHIKMDVRSGAPAIYNDPRLVDLLRKNLATFPLQYDLVTEFRTPGADDFSYYCQHVPGVMVRIGVRTDSMQSSLHEGLFDVADEALTLASAFFTHQCAHLGELFAAEGV